MRYLLLSILLILGLYLLTSLIYQAFSVELRFLWPLLKPLTAERFSLFFCLLVTNFSVFLHF